MRDEEKQTPQDVCGEVSAADDPRQSKLRKQELFYPSPLCASTLAPKLSHIKIVTCLLLFHVVSHV